MKKTISLLLLSFFSIFVFITTPYAQEDLSNDVVQDPLTIYLFYSNSCPPCDKAIDFLEEFDSQNDQVNLTMFEINNWPKNRELLLAVSERLDSETDTVPFIVIGTSFIVDYTDQQTTGNLIENIVNENISKSDYQDIVQQYLLQLQSESTDTDESLSSAIEVNNFTGQPLYLSTIHHVIYQVWNTFTLWIWLLLLTLLLGIAKKKHAWIIGGSYILFAGFFTFLSTTLLDDSLISNQATTIQGIMGIIAVTVSIFTIYRFISQPQKELHVNKKLQPHKSKNIWENIIHGQSIIPVVAGVLIFAIATSTIEWIYSAEVNAQYIELIENSRLSPVQYYSYILLQTFWRLLDDIVIFVCALYIIQRFKIGHEYAKHSFFLAGMVLFIMGLFVLFKPEWLLLRIF